MLEGDLLKILKLFLLLSFTVLLCASEIEDKKKLDAEFAAAKALYEKKDYKKAYDKFYTIFLNNLRDPNVNFYLGQSAFMMKHYDEAITAYERILFVDDKATRVKLELARSHMGNGSFEQAKEIFEEVLKEKKLPKNVKLNVERYLQAIEDKDIKNTLSGILIVGFGYDDNVEALSTGYVSEVSDGLISTNSLIESWTHQEMVALNHVYKYSDTVVFKNDAMFFMKNFTSFTQRNIQFLQYNPSISVMHSPKLSIDYGLLYSRVWLDTASLVTNYAIYPKLRYMISKSVLLGASLRFQQKFNDDSANRDRDAKYWEVAVNAQTIHTDKFSTFAELKLSSERKIRGVLTDVDYDLLNITIAGIYKATKDLSFSLKGKAFRKPYLENYLPGKAARNDDEYQAYVGATYTISKKYVLQAEYVYTDHQSNYNDFEFKKNTYTLNFISLF